MVDLRIETRNLGVAKWRPLDLDGCVSDSTSPAEALLRLQQYRHDGARTPHKPLLVLLALSQLADRGTSELQWDTVGSRLGELLVEFGPAATTPALQRAAYPFTRLRSDGVWELSDDVPMDTLSGLRSGGISGHLTSAIERELLADPARIPVLARRIVDAQWPSTVADDVLLAVGFDPELSTASTAVVGALGRKRSAAWRVGILAGWDRSCAFCGFDGALAGAPVGIEAAHVRWFNFDGPDELDNGLALCSLHHKLFDRGALGLSLNHVVLVSDRFHASGTGRSTYELHGKPLTPRPGTPLPAVEHLEWHAREVFQGASLSA